jgi:SAM-dependent methyltransferase
VVAVDRAVGMLGVDRDTRPPAAVGDALALPFGDSAFDVVVAAFCLNHLADPVAGLREAGRVARGYVLASTFAADDDHPVKQAVDAALAEAGWACPGWYPEVKAASAAWGTIDGAAAVVAGAGLAAVAVEHVRVPFPELGATDLVRWRLGMAHCAEFAGRGDVEARALELLGDPPPLVRSALFIVARGR